MMAAPSPEQLLARKSYLKQKLSVTEANLPRMDGRVYCGNLALALLAESEAPLDGDLAILQAAWINTVAQLETVRDAMAAKYENIWQEIESINATLEVIEARALQNPPAALVALYAAEVSKSVIVADDVPYYSKADDINKLSAAIQQVLSDPAQTGTAMVATPIGVQELSIQQMQDIMVSVMTFQNAVQEAGQETLAEAAESSYNEWPEIMATFNESFEAAYVT